jgi:hypothetical protein
MGSSFRLGHVSFSSLYEWHFIKNIYGEPGKSRVGVYVTADDHHGFLHLRFEVNGEPIAQTFKLAGKAMRVGGLRWTVKCPESGKMVRDLYLVLGRNHTHFHSRHALGLSYCSNWRKKRHWERAKKLMERLGATEWREPPIRPKNMQRRTFKRLADELWDAWQRDVHANFGVALDRDALASFGIAEMEDLIDKRLCRPPQKAPRVVPPPKASQVIESMSIIAAFHFVCRAEGDATHLPVQIARGVPLAIFFCSSTRSVRARALPP